MADCGFTRPGDGEGRQAHTCRVGIVEANSMHKSLQKVMAESREKPGKWSAASAVILTIS